MPAQKQRDFQVHRPRAKDASPWSFTRDVVSIEQNCCNWQFSRKKGDILGKMPDLTKQYRGFSYPNFGLKVGKVSILARSSQLVLSNLKS